MDLGHLNLESAVVLSDLVSTSDAIEQGLSPGLSEIIDAGTWSDDEEVEVHPDALRDRFL